MEIRFLRRSESHLLSNFRIKGWFFLPMYSVLSKELKLCLAQVTKQNYLDTYVSKRSGQQIVGFFDNKHLFMLARIEKKQDCLLVHSAILAQESKLSWQDFIDLFERLTKESGAQGLSFQLKSSISPDFQQRFKHCGYTNEGSNYHKTLAITRGIALGGGGARGSYGIGVWKYFDEQKYEFDVICGTSIGASTAGLMISSSVEHGIKMWEEIETAQVLDFDVPSANEITLPNLLTTIREMARSSISNIGISSAPLYNLIQKYYDLDKLYKTDKKLGVVTVELFHLEEVAIHLQEKPVNEWVDWMIASGSFFPMMQAKKIEANYYIDGGYRNNVPIDFTQKLGANLIVEVDVQGPGLNKKVVLPHSCGNWRFVSPWTLGTILIFDGKRSAQNIQLGYLETKKMFERNFGYWYTFENADFEDLIESLHKEFWDYLQKAYQKTPNNFASRLARMYKKEVAPEEIPLAMLEILGKFAEILPSEPYTIESFTGNILKEMDKVQDFEEQHSLGEWFGKYFRELVALSDFQIFQKIRSWFAQDGDKQARVQLLMDILPEYTLLVLLFEYMEEKHERISI